MNLGREWRALATFAVIAATVVFAGQSPAGANDHSDPIVVDDAAAAIDALVLPPIPDEMLTFATEVQSTYEEDPRFSAVEITLDRKTVIVWWHDRPPAALVEDAENASFPVAFESTPLLPGDLREAAREAVRSGDLGVTSATPKKDGTGVTVTLVEAPQSRSSADRAAAPIETKLGIPVTVSTEVAPIAASRQADLYGLGGARVYRWSGSAITGGCTTGFAVQNGSQRGVMFAAHCANNGDQIVMWPNSTGSTVYYYVNNGVVGAWNAASDAAVIATNSNIGAVYTGAWNNNTGITIAGWRASPIGTEICYSGSYSGFICGNVVQEKGVTYTLGGANGASVPVLYAVRTEHALGTPAIGQGDSGGPGVIPVLIDGQARIVAGTIISAIPGNSGTMCSGIQDGRLCSSTGFSTLIGTALAGTGWSVTIQ